MTKHDLMTMYRNAKDINRTLYIFNRVVDRPYAVEVKEAMQKLSDMANMCAAELTNIREMEK